MLVSQMYGSQEVAAWVVGGDSFLEGAADTRGTHIHGTETHGALKAAAAYDSRSAHKGSRKQQIHADPCRSSRGRGGTKGACGTCSNGYRYVEAGWLRSRRSPGGGTLSRTVSVQLLNGRVDGDAARRRSGGCGRIGEQQKGWKILRVQKMMR